MEPVQNVTRRTRACGPTEKTWAVGAVAQNRYWSRGSRTKVAQVGVELLTLSIRLDRHATERLLLPSVVTGASDQGRHFDENALVFWRASIRHDFDQKADNLPRCDPTAAGIETRRLDLRDPE